MRSNMEWIYRRLIFGAAILLVGVFTSHTLFAQSTDSSFSTERLPIKAWLDGKDTSQLEWTVRVSQPRLTDYQRYEVSIVAFVWLNKADAAENTSNLLTFARFTDSHGKSYEARNTYALPRRTDDQQAEIATNFAAYLLPGDYKVAIVAYGTGSRKHSVRHQMIHVPDIPKDPLPSAWNGLPAVEFMPLHAPFGLVDGRLNLSLQASQPLRVEVIANVTPSYALKPYPVIYRRNRDAIFPELNVLSQIRAPNGTLDVVALELDDQKVAFEQNGVDRLDARSLWRSLNAHSTSVVDASALAGENREAKFFLSQVNKRITALAAPSGSVNANVPTVVIVLSNQMAFPKGEDLAPISVSGDCNCRVFYIRTHVMLDTFPTFGRTPFRMGPGPDVTVGPPDTSPTGGLNFPPGGDGGTKISNVDQLEKTLAPLNPRVLEVKNVEDFRKAVAVILSEAGGL